MSQSTDSLLASAAMSKRPSVNDLAVQLQPSSGLQRLRGGAQDNDGTNQPGNDSGAGQRLGHADAAAEVKELDRKLCAPDAALDPSIYAVIRKYLRHGSAKEVVQKLAGGYVGYPTMATLTCSWLAELDRLPADAGQQADSNTEAGNSKAQSDAPGVHAVTCSSLYNVMRFARVHNTCHALQLRHCHGSLGYVSWYRARNLFCGYVKTHVIV